LLKTDKGLAELGRFLDLLLGRRLGGLEEVLRVLELAAGAVRAVEVLVEPFAELGLVVLRHVGLGVELVRAMGE